MEGLSEVFGDDGVGTVAVGAAIDVESGRK